jgi:protein-disulfide isomerase
LSETRPRPLGVAVIALVLLVVGATVAGIALRQPDDDEIEIEGAGEVQRLISGIPQDGARLGDESAPVTIEVFNDLQCPSCADWQRDSIDPLIEQAVRPGELQLVFHHFSLSQRETTLAAYGATAAGEQGRQWQFIELFFLNQDEADQEGVTDEFLQRIAAAVLELDEGQWEQDLDGDEVRELVEQDAELAAERRLPAEPAVVVTGPLRDRELVDSPSLDEIEQAVEDVG